MDDMADPPYFLPTDPNATPPMPRAKQRHVSVGSAAQEILVVAESRNQKPDIKRLREILTDCRDDGLEVDGILRAAVDDRGYGLGHLATKCRWYEGLGKNPRFSDTVFNKGLTNVWRVHVRNPQACRQVRLGPQH